MAVCKSCGTNLPPQARFCHVCGAPVGDHTAPMPSSLPLQVGQKVCDEYVIENLTGGKGSRWLYRARHELTGQSVVVVFQAPDALTSEERILAEARRLRALKHPNIPVLYAIRQEAGGFVAVFDRPRGQPLARLLVRGRLSTASALHVGHQLLDALAHAHGAGIVHGRIHPALLWLADNDHLTVTGFGELQVFSSLPTGTDRAAYLPPELAMGRGADTRTDVYAAGLMLYTLLAGHPPFQARSEYELLRQQVESPPPNLANAASAVSPPIANVVLRALVKDPQGRYRDGQDFLEAFRKAQKASLRDRAYLHVPRSTVPATPAAASPEAPAHEAEPAAAAPRLSPPPAAPPPAEPAEPDRSPDQGRSPDAPVPSSEEGGPADTPASEAPERTPRHRDEEVRIPALQPDADSSFDLAEVGLGSHRRVRLLVLMVVLTILAAVAAVFAYDVLRQEDSNGTKPESPSPAEEGPAAEMPDAAAPEQKWDAAPRPSRASRPPPRPRLPPSVKAELPKLAKARSKKAAERLERLLADYPWSQEVKQAAAAYYEAAAWRALNDGMYRRSLEAARKATSLNPNARIAWFCLGYALRQSGKKQESKAAFRRYLELCEQARCRYVGMARRMAR